MIRRLAEDLLARFTGLPLLDRYDIYQRLMDYWQDTMQDDVYLIAAEGWLEAAKPRAVIEDKEKKIKEEPDLKLGRQKYKMDLVPPALIVARYFAKEQAAIDELQTKQEAAERELVEYVEENSGEEGLLADAVNEKGKVTKAAVRERLVEIGMDPDLAEERVGLEKCIEIIEVEAEAARAVRDAQAALDEQVFKRYAKLTEVEIKGLVIQDKWFTTLRTSIEDEIQRLAQRLSTRVKDLEERYAKNLPELEREVAKFTVKVEDHLIIMGVNWK